ncbi:MAG: DUF2244 domain-containing protein [Janthinobacterium lividum]
MDAGERRDESETMLKEWTLRRNCSMTPRQVALFYLSLFCFSLTVAVFWVAHGAWMVLPFTGIELLALGIALLMYARHAVDYEYIRLCENQLVVESMCAERLTHLEFNPRWVRVEPGATARDQITLWSSGESVAIGRHLALHRREEFARELRLWLKRCG